MSSNRIELRWNRRGRVVALFAGGLGLASAALGACSAPDPNMVIDLESSQTRGSRSDAGTASDGAPSITNPGTDSSAPGTTTPVTQPAVDAGTSGPVDSSSPNPNPGNPNPPDPGTPPGPTIASFSPIQAVAGTSAFNLGVSGTNFAAGCSIMLSSTELSTTFVSSTVLTATVPATMIAGAGSLPVSVRCAGKTVSSNTFFQVTPGEAPPHTVTSFAPLTAQAGATQFGLSVGGTNFTANCVVLFGADQLTTGFQSSSALAATVPAALVQTAGSYAIRVQCGNRILFAPSSFSVTEPPPPVATTPVLTSVSPTQVALGSSFALKVTGSNFISGQTQVLFNNAIVTTSVTSATSLSAAIPSTLTSTTGLKTVRLRNVIGASEAFSARTLSVSVVAIRVF